MNAALSGLAATAVAARVRPEALAAPSLHELVETDGESERGPFGSVCGVHGHTGRHGARRPRRSRRSEVRRRARRNREQVRLPHGRRPRFKDHRKVKPLLVGPVLRLLLRRARKGRLLGSLFYSYGPRLLSAEPRTPAAHLQAARGHLRQGDHVDRPPV